MPILQISCRARLGATHFDVDASTGATWLVLFGPSGSGKSSVLRLLAGLWSPPGATVRLHNEDLSGKPAHLRRVSYVAQRPALFPHRHVLGNVLFGCRDRALADTLLNAFELTHLQRSDVRRLSGGERQRVALAQALAASPRLLLLDEVFTGMHLAQRDLLLTRIQQHCKQQGIPVVSVTHDVLEAGLVAGEVLKLEAGHVAGQGRFSDVLAEERSALQRTFDKATG